MIKCGSIVSGKTQTVPEKTKYSHTTKDEHVSNGSKSLPLLISFNNGLLWNGDCYVLKGRLKRIKIGTCTQSIAELLNQPRDIAQSNLIMRLEVCSLFQRMKWLFSSVDHCDSKRPQLSIMMAGT